MTGYFGDYLGSYFGDYMGKAPDVSEAGYFGPFCFNYFGGYFGRQAAAETVVGGSLRFDLYRNLAYYQQQNDMTAAKQRTYHKRPSEIVSMLINCGPVLVQGETIATIATGDVVQQDGDGNTLSGGDLLTFSGATNTETINEPGLQSVPFRRGIVGLVSGGNAALSQPYKLTIPFTTSGGQRRDAEVYLEIRP